VQPRASRAATSPAATTTKAGHSVAHDRYGAAQSFIAGSQPGSIVHKSGVPRARTSTTLSATQPIAATSAPRAPHAGVRRSTSASPAPSSRSSANRNAQCTPASTGTAATANTFAVMPPIATPMPTAVARATRSAMVSASAPCRRRR
jgi:hypothetical protein